MKRELLALTGDLVRELAAANGWARVRVAHHEGYGNLIEWQRGEIKVFTNVPEEFPEPLLQAVRARLLVGLTHECPRCGVRAVLRDPEALTETETDRAQVITALATQESIDIGIEDGEVEAAVRQIGDAGHVVLLHDEACEAAAANFDELAQARWN